MSKDIIACCANCKHFRFTIDSGYYDDVMCSVPSNIIKTYNYLNGAIEVPIEEPSVKNENNDCKDYSQDFMTRLYYNIKKLISK